MHQQLVTSIQSNILKYILWLRFKYDVVEIVSKYACKRHDICIYYLLLRNYPNSTEEQAIICDLIKRFPTRNCVKFLFRNQKRNSSRTQIKYFHLSHTILAHSKTINHFDRKRLDVVLLFQQLHL